MWHDSRLAVGEWTFNAGNSHHLGGAYTDEVYQAMRNNPGLPDKDEFVQKLNTKLQARLSIQFSQTNKRGNKGLR